MKFPFELYFKIAVLPRRVTLGTWELLTIRLATAADVVHVDFFLTSTDIAGNIPHHWLFKVTSVQLSFIWSVSYVIKIHNSNK